MRPTATPRLPSPPRPRAPRPSRRPAVLEGRRIVLGVSGGIAAYKAIDVCRRLVDRGAHVVPVMTRGATRFVGTATFSALASEPVHTSLFEDPDPIPHTRLGQSADLVVVAPATARVIGSYAAGISNDLLTATLLATEAPVVVCPAMHTEMWQHPAVQDNLATLARRGVHIVPPEEGRLAGGDVGAGRLAAPPTIVDGVRGRAGALRATWPGSAVLVTAGGTREPIDPVRFVGNRSSGKQGHALAAEAAARGAKVTLITTVDLPVPAGADAVRVETAAQMDEAVRDAAEGADVIVMAAAVADFRPATVAATKLKKRRRGARDRARADRRHPGRPGRAQAGGSDTGRIRCRDRSTCDRMQRPSSWPKAQTSSSPMTSRPRALGSSTTPTGRDPRRRRHRATTCHWPTSGPLPEPSSTAVLAQENAIVSRWTFTSESVTEGHPDKMADQISRLDPRRDPDPGPDRPGGVRDHGHHRPRHRGRRDHHVRLRRDPLDRARDDQAASATTASPSASTATPAAS